PGEGPQVRPIRVPLGPGAMSPWVGWLHALVLGLSAALGVWGFCGLVFGQRKMREPDREP
ncbi:MAG: hypothetical protein ACO3UM_16475, partial [Planctomycetota bacterium]